MQRSRPTTILLVNDDRSAIETFARLLRFEGYEVRTASNAEAGLHEAEASKPDAIILDFRTPITDGLGFVRRLRARDDHRDTPVAIVCNDYFLDDSITAEVRALGAELQFKPLWLQDLVGIAERLAGAARGRSQEPLDFDEPLLDGLPLDSADERPARQEWLHGVRGTNPDETRATVELPVNYRSIVESSPDIIARFDREYRCVYVNRANEPLVAAITPLPNVRRFPRSGASATISQVWERGLERVLTAGEPHTIELRCPVGEGFRDYQVFLAPERDGHDAVRSVMTIARDITDDVTARRLAEERLLRDVLYDKLTGLPNRALLMERLEHAAARFRRNPDHPFAVLFIDLDNFKVVNDSLGHAVGDQLLVSIARRLISCLRADDTLARLGGDEFVVLTGDLTGPEDACDLAERIQKELRTPFSIEAHEIFKTASIGIASSSMSDESCENLLRDADTAMYRAKMRGRACYEVFSDSMHQEAVQRLQLESDLRSALANGEFRVYYQPIISARTGDITGVEALLRWQHPIRGLLGPADFLSIADEIGLMVPIGEWVLRTACAEVKAWEERGLSRVRVGVNISAGQFREPALGDVVEAALRDSGLDPRDLELELTEHIVFSSAPPTVAALKRLTDLGTRLAVDDFGLVHSSLRYMLRVPLASLKIDKSFIHDISTDETGPTVMKALIALGHTLGLNVVAEGVETEEQDRFLVGAGCDELQGFFGGVPLRPEDVQALLASQSAVEPLHSMQVH